MSPRSFERQGSGEPHFEHAEVIESKIGDHEKTLEFISFASALRPVLSPEELKEFVADPIGFRSEELYFRGLDNSKLDKVLQTHVFESQSGNFGSTGVFVTNSLYDAFRYSNGIVAVLDKDKINLSSEKVFKVGSPDYNQAVDEALKTDPSLSVYYADSALDLFEDKNYGSGDVEQIITLRKPQPVTATKCFLIKQEKNNSVNAYSPEELLLEKAA